MAKYRREGDCNQCGECCTRVIGKYGRLAREKIKILEEKGWEKRDKCAYLGWREGKAYCKVHKERPWICMLFPEGPDDLEGLPNCSYTFVRLD